MARREFSKCPACALQLEEPGSPGVIRVCGHNCDVMCDQWPLTSAGGGGGGGGGVGGGGGGRVLSFLTGSSEQVLADVMLRLKVT